MPGSPSIFNDVIGPVMRGPSSSHTAASWRIAKMCLHILNEPLKKAVVDFDKNGAWAPNFREQGTVMGIDGGLLDLDITDPQMKNTNVVQKERRISIHYEVNSFPTRHPNTVRISLEGKYGRKIRIIAASLGGGSFEIQQLDEFRVSITGDSYELFLLNRQNLPILADLKSILPQDLYLKQIKGENGKLIQIKSSNAFPNRMIEQLKEVRAFDDVIELDPVMPVLAGNESVLPFSSVLSLLEYSEKENLDLGDLGILYEKHKSGFSSVELNDKMREIVGIIETSINTGIKGTEYNDRILHHQSHLVGNAAQKGHISNNKQINDIITNVTAIMEAKSAMEVIVANPTAGSCGTVGGVLKAVADDLGSTPEEIIKAYFAAGITGVYFAEKVGFSAEEHGCQVECGAASGMAASGITQLFGGTARQAINAASMAIQNSLGLICDPVADRVEVPCLGKNVNAAMNALSSATMARANFDSVIPFEEVLNSILLVSRDMPECVKCTGKGGLAITPSSLKIKARLNKATN